MKFLLVPLLVLLLSHGIDRADSARLHASNLEKFVDELPQIPVVRAFHQDKSFLPAKLTIGMYLKRWKFHRDLPATPVFAYGRRHKQASIPGPTIEARNGMPVEITWRNNLPAKHILPLDQTISTANSSHGGIPTVVHLHGGMNDPASDGHSMAWSTFGLKDRGPAWRSSSSIYRNAQGPGTLWYHDHAMGLTRVNILAGLSGAYVIRDPAVERRMNLPSGKDFDRVLILSDRDFNTDGTMYMSSKGNNPLIHPHWQPEYFGSVILVNGKAWPFLRVQRRKYRFRIINTSNARFYRLHLSGNHSGNPDDSRSLLIFTQVASDAFYLPHPVRTRRITIAPSEIHDVIVDFSQTRGSEVLLTNTAAYPFPTGDAVDANTGVVMKFLVSKTKSSPKKIDQGSIAKFLLPIQRLSVDQSTVTRHINLYEFVNTSNDEPTHLLINALPFDSPATETPQCGSTELWVVINLTEDNHPFHVHLAAFQVVDETKLKDPEALRQCLLENGNRMNSSCNAAVFAERPAKPRKPPSNEAGWKNVYKMKPGFVTRFLVRFTAIDGKPYPFDATAEPGYSYHCHILDHEDNEMMRPLKLRW